MPVTAPLRVPVELRAGRVRHFRLASAISEQGLWFPRPLPAELEGPLALSFVLPAAASADEEAREPPLQVRGRAVDVESGEADGTEPSAVRFLALEEEPRARIARYVAERVPA